MLTESTNNLTYEKLSQEEMQSRGILGRLVGVCADFMSPTRNGRKYPEELWENIFNSDIMKERISNGVCFGELGHPADREETDMEKICICMPEEPKKGPDGKLRAVFDILDTPNGRILKSLCDYGSTLGISSRGSGDLETDFDGQESVNPDTYNCEGFDIVLLPGVKDARLQYVTESLHMNEGAVTPKHKINLEAREFNYTMNYGADTTDIHSAVVVIPDGLKAEDGTTMDASVHCEDLNGNVIDFTSVKEAQEWIDNYGDSCVYYIKNGTELHATPEEAYDESRAIELESVDLNKKRNHKTLRQQLQESINNETDDNKRIMKESLNTLGIKLNEKFIITKIDDNKYALAKGNPPITDLRKTVEANSPEEAKEILMQYGYSPDELTIDNTLLDESAYDDLVSMLSESLELNEALTPEQKMDAWHNGTRRQNIKACKDEKLIMYLKICMDKGYQREVDIIEDELDRRGVDYRDFTSSAQQKRMVKFGPDRLPKAKMLDFNDEKVLGISTRVRDSAILNDLGVDISKLEVLQPADDNDTYFVIRKEYPFAEKVAQAILDIYNKYNDDIDESLDDSIDINDEEHLADDNDMAMVNELQEALKLNKKLDEKIVNLQEKLSACYAKEMELEESIDSYKIKITKLSNKSKENKALTEKLSKLEKELLESKQEVSQRKTTLHETMQRDAKERKQFQESIESKDNKIHELTKQLKESTNKIHEFNENVNNLNEQLETAHKDNRQLKEKYSKKLDANNKLIEKYKKIAKSAVDKYINKQATILGVSSNEIKNRLPESYSFNDIEKVCESLREYRVNMNSLPFSTNTQINESVGLSVNNIDNRTLVRNVDDEISETDIKLAERFIQQNKK